MHALKVLLTDDMSDSTIKSDREKNKNIFSLKILKRKIKKLR